MISGIVKEFPEEIGRLVVENDVLYFREGERIRALKDNKFRIVLEKKNLVRIKFGLKGVWLETRVKDNDDEKYFNEFVDLFNKGVSYGSQGEPVAEGKFEGNTCALLASDPVTSESRLVVLNFEKNSKRILSDIPRYRFSLDDEHIYTQSKEGKLACFDIEFNKKWEVIVPYTFMFRIPREPIFYKDLVIFNLGYDTHTQEKGKIVALKKSNGAKIWEQEFDQEVTHLFLYDQKIILTSQTGLYSMQADSGDLMFHLQYKIENSHKDETVFFDGRLIFLIIPSKSSMHIYSEKKLHLIEELKIPQPYVPAPHEALLEFQNRFYLPLVCDDPSLSDVVYGLLELERHDINIPSKITIEQRPNYQVNKLKGTSNDEYYQIILMDDDLERVLKYGQIVLKECAQVNGSHVWSDERRNPNFNGKLCFVTDLGKLSNNEKQKLRNMVKSVENWAREMSIKAGNRKDPILTELAPMLNK